METFAKAFPFMVNNFGLLLEKTGEHVYVSLIALAISVLIGLPVGLWLGHIHKGEFLAVPPILSYAFEALNSIDRSITKAARGMGMSPLQVLWNVELPLGLPTIFAGLRTSTVLVVSSATLATIAGGGGLGDIILNQVAYGMEGVIAAALWVALLSILADQLMALLLKLVAPAGVKRMSTGLAQD